MFKNLSNSFSKLVNTLKSSTRLSEKNIAQMLEKIEHNLLDADVSIDVIKTLTQNIKAECLSQKITNSLTPGQLFTQIFYEKLTGILSTQADDFNLRARPPAIVLLAGLQGAGKTTTAAKLAYHIKKKLRKRVLMASADVYRPAALDQLYTLADMINCDCFKHNNQDAIKASTLALEAAQTGLYDVLILDTAGRNTLDDAMMDEIKKIQNTLAPKETLFVADSMLGQQAAHIAKQFNQAIEISGVILTKMDGDARGGAALSIAHVTKKPIKFIGTGEKIEKLESFNPQSSASIILGLGDMQSLVEKLTDSSNTHKKPFSQNQFTLNDLKKEFIKIEKSGGILALTKYLPQHIQKDPRLNQSTDFKKYIYAIDSMTKKERLDSSILKASHKIRISKGSGVSIQTINQLLIQFKQVAKIHKKSKNKRQFLRMLS